MKDSFEKKKKISSREKIGRWECLLRMKRDNEIDNLIVDLKSACQHVSIFAVFSIKFALNLC